MGTMLVIFIIFGILSVFESYYFMNYGTTYFGNSLGITWAMWIVAAISLVVFFCMRRYLQKKYTALLNEETLEGNSEAEQSTYVYQMPMMKMVDDMPVIIRGKKEMYFQLYFNSFWQKCLTLFDILPVAGVRLTSPEHTVEVRPIKLISNRNFFEVFLNEELYGKLTQKQFLKEGGIKKAINFTFTSPAGEFSIENNYLDLLLTMQNNQEVLLRAKREFFDFMKDEKTGKRGEKHEVNVTSEEIPDEVFIAIYTIMMNLRND